MKQEADVQSFLRIFASIMIFVVGVFIELIWLVDSLFDVLQLHTWLIAIVLTLYTMGLAGLAFLIILGPPGQKRKLGNTPLDHISAAIGFLDMLCHGIIEMGSVHPQDSTWDLPDYDSLSVRNRAGSTLYLLDKNAYEKWAQAVQARVPEWTRLGVIKISPLSVISEGCFILIILIMSGVIAFYQTFGIFGLVVTTILAVVGIASYFTYRKYMNQEPDKLLLSDAFQQESCKALQIILDAAKKQSTSKFRVFIIGNYDQLTYTEKTITTSNGHILHQAILEPYNI